MLLVFEQLFDKMNREEQRKVLESLIAEIHLYSKETWKQGQNPIREINYTFSVTPQILEELRDNLPTVETVVLLEWKDR